MITLDYIDSKYDHLPLTEFVERVGQLFTTSTTSFEKFERLQTFQEPELPSYSAWMAGRKRESQQLYFSTTPSSAEMYRNAAKRQISATRVRVVERPFTRSCPKIPHASMGIDKLLSTPRIGVHKPPLLWRFGATRSPRRACAGVAWSDRN